MIIQHGLVSFYPIFSDRSSLVSPKEETDSASLLQFSTERHRMPAPAPWQSGLPKRAFVVVPLQEFQEVHIQPAQNAAEKMPEKLDVSPSGNQIVTGAGSHGPLSYTIDLLKRHKTNHRVHLHRDIVTKTCICGSKISPWNIRSIYTYIYIIIIIYIYHCIIIYPHVVSHDIPIDGKSTSISKKSDAPEAQIGLPTTRRRCTDAFGRRRHPTSARCAAWHQRVLTSPAGWASVTNLTWYRCDDFDARNP